MAKQNLYDILQVKKDCSAQEIKTAFIELSKKYHPDKSANSADHKIFVKINDAYSVLSKPSARRLYDHDMAANMEREYHHYYENVYSTRNDPAYREKRARGFGFGNEPYYSIKGLKKVSNSVIVAACLIFISVGVGVEYMAIA